jgi:hypothetical protein
VVCFCFVFIRPVYPCCQFLWTAHFWLALRYFPTGYIIMYNSLDKAKHARTVLIMLYK